MQAIEKIDQKLPTDFYQKNCSRIHNNVPHDPCEITLPPDTFFYIPFKDNFPELDRLALKNQNKDISLLFTYPKEEVVTKSENSIGYPLQTLFECYRDSFPTYNYNEFEIIVLNELHSNKIDQEVLESFLETFGYEPIEFLSEIIKNRNKIEYSTPIYGEFSPRFPLHFSFYQ